MKLLDITLVLAGLISIGATALAPHAVVQSSVDNPGRLLLEHDVSKYAYERGPLDGAPGASAIGFRVNAAVQGGGLIVRLDQPVLGVFVGLNVPDEFINEPYKDLRVTFTLADGSMRTVKAAGGGGTAMLFQSPVDVPMSSLRKVALYVDAGAAWAR